MTNCFTPRLNFHAIKYVYKVKAIDRLLKTNSIFDSAIVLETSGPCMQQYI